MTAKRHTVGSIAAELRALLPTLTERAGQVLTTTLLRDVCHYTPAQLITADVPVATADRTKIMRFAKNRYL